MPLARRSAEIRQEVERALARSGLTVCVDFSGITVTQSFIDEFLGVLILRRGPAFLRHLAFRECSEEVRAVIRFVVSSRIHDFNNGMHEQARLAEREK